MFFIKTTLDHDLDYETVCLFSLFVEAKQNKYDNVIALNSQSFKVLRYTEKLIMLTIV